MACRPRGDRTPVLEVRVARERARWARRAEQAVQADSGSAAGRLRTVSRAQAAKAACEIFQPGTDTAVSSGA